MKENLENENLVWSLDKILEDGSHFVGAIKEKDGEYSATAEKVGEKPHELAIPELTFSIAKEWVKDAYLHYAERAHEAKMIVEHPNETSIRVAESVKTLSNGVSFHTYIDKDTKTGEYHGCVVEGDYPNINEVYNTHGGYEHQWEAERWCQRLIEKKEQELEPPHRGYHR